MARERRPTPLRRVYLVTLAVMILLPMGILTLTARYEYRADVERIERLTQTTNEQIAQLARRSLLSLLNRTAGILARAELRPEDLEDLPVRRWVEEAPGETSASSAPSVQWRAAVGRADVPFQIGVRPATTEPHAREVLLRVAIAGRPEGDRYRVATLEPRILREWLTARFETFINRHVYVSDATGQPIFYSNDALLKDPRQFAVNPPVALFLAGGSGPLTYTSAISGRRRVGYVLPVPEVGWGLVVSADIAESILDIRRRYLLVVAALLSSGALAVGVFFYFSRRLIEPLFAITREIRRQDRPRHALLRLPESVQRIREFQMLVQDFNEHILNLRKAESEVIQAEKMATFGEITAGLAHEIGTPLNVMRGNAQFLMRKLAPDDPGREVLQKIIDQTGRIADLIRVLLDLGRQDSALPVPLSLEKVVARAVQTNREIHPGVEVEVAVAGGLPVVQGYPRRLEHALLNLLANGSQAMAGQGRMRVAVDRAGDDHAPAVRIVVEDHGCGIPPDVLPQIFKPFFSTKGSGQGSGLGLALVDRVVREHGGTIDVTSAPGQGARFAITLPAAREKEVEVER